MISRRNTLSVITGLASAAVISADKARADESGTNPVFPGTIPLKLNMPVRVAAQSAPVRVNDTDLRLVYINSAMFAMDASSRLTATLKGAITQYTRVDYWISVAVFDAAGQLLGAANHKEAVQYERVRAMPTMLREIKLDFGVSKAFQRAALVAIVISDPDVPKPA
jgi:hypothetical protein